MTASKVRALFQEETDAFNQHDIERFASRMTDDVKVTAPGIGEISGRAAAQTFYGSWLDAFPDARVEIDAVHCLDDVAMEEGRFLGTHRATLHTPNGDLPATGRSVNVEYMQVTRYRGDKIASFHLVFDQMEMLEQLGLMEGAEAEPAHTTQQPGAGQSPH